MKGLTLGNYEVLVTKEDIMDMADFLYENSNSEVEIVYSNDLEVLLLKTRRTTLVKIIPSCRVTTVCNSTEKIEAATLYTILNNIIITELLNELEGVHAC